MSSSVHVDNKIKDTLVLGEGLTQGLDDTTLTSAKKTTFIEAELELDDSVESDSE